MGQWWCLSGRGRTGKSGGASRGTSGSDGAARGSGGATPRQFTTAAALVRGLQVQILLNLHFLVKC